MARTFVVDKGSCVAGSSVPAWVYILGSPRVRSSSARMKSSPKQSQGLAPLPLSMPV